ncbi:peroxiredoxin family protein [Humisphaera borealis]|uniref:thioredoxin-dependent peroxiredoxin n=1 Tax=Humisphaera borealis TaxID=2807512 RepID=A0A7M2WSY9_9BACT|nr:peroxiredoxin family protein [Humisphaera borealis]QOV88618.1 peroxiredoxin family protein [Humisphaera borealis]
MSTDGPTIPATRLESARVGLPAPDFVIPDIAGNSFRPFDALPVGGLILVFYRGHWCPYCRRYLCKLQANLKRIEEAGGRVVAISPEPPSAGAAMARELGLTFTILSDTGGQVIDHFGTRNGFLGGSSVLPHPSVFVIDNQGVVRFRSIDRNYKKRTTIRTIMGVLATLAVTAQASPAGVQGMAATAMDFA